MRWQSVRLELDRTREFPRGSASRAYLLRLPLREDGEIDEQAVARTPERATMRRMWPGEPELSGYIHRLDRRWGFVSAVDKPECAIVPGFQPQPIAEGGLVTLIERDGRQLPFRVAKLRPLTGRT